MNKIYKVMYSKVKQCAVVVSELAKSHVKSSHGSNGQQKAALTMSVLLALGAFTFAFGPANAEAADEKHYTEGQQYIGVYHTSDDTVNAENHQSGLVAKNQGALGVGAISIGVHAEAGTGTITIGNRLAPTAQDSVFIGSKYDVAGKVYTTASSKVVSIGADSNASGTGSVALGYGAAADVSNVSGEGKNPDKESQSIAIGFMATAKQNNIALGANSVATDAASQKTAEFRDNKDSDYNAPSSYVSVGSSTLKRRITNVAAGADENDVATVGQLKKVADNKIAWKLTTAGDNDNASTVSAGDTVDFSAAKDSKENGQATGKDHSNLTISKEKENGTNKVNMTVGLSDNVVLGQNASGKGGSLDVYRAVGDASSNQLGSHVRIDGSTVSVRYDNGTDSNARGAVLGIANDSYQDTNDATKTVSSPLGYVYLRDGGNYYYLHGAMHGDTNYQGRLAYDTESGSNYIANLDDGLKFTGDAKNITVETKLDPNAANNTLSITGGVTDSGKLTSGNIGVVATANTTDENDNVTSGGLSIQLAKNLTGITSISNQTTSSTTTTGAKIELGTNGTTISGGDVNVSSNKITNLKNGEADTDAATVGQMNTAIGNAKTKYYSVKDGIQLSSFTNSDNSGASAVAGMAAGYTTGTNGIASTVVGSYSGVMNTGTSSSIFGRDVRGAAAVSVGTVNVNNNSTSKTYSGVANSIVGQANMTTNSNAAIIYGAGNTVTDSYRPIDEKKAVAILTSISDQTKLREALQAAVKDSGGQVMVMGGGNNVESAYMSQVVGVGNTVTGADSTYAEGTSTQYNFVDGFQNELTNGKNDYIIGSNNSVTGDHIDKNQSNIVVGDNHTLTNRKNNVVIGSADKKENKNKELTASDATVIGHNADVTVDGGVAIGSGSVSKATAEADAEGYDPVSTTTNKASTNTSATWKATTGAVSIGGVNGNTTTTRRITNLAAGFNDTDAVNVAQIKKLASINASNIGANLQYGADGTTEATDIDKTENKKAWATAIGTGTVTKDDDGSKQMVTGKTVYDALHGGLDNITVGKDGQNGKDGSIGIAGQNGKDGYTMTIIKTEQGAAGVDGKDGKDGITRVIYQDKDGSKKHTIATLDDGLKFKGDNSTVITKKLDEQLNIIGGASTELTESNIGVNSTTDGSLKIQLAKDLTSITSISGSTDDKGAKITLDTTDKNISLNGGSIKDVASNLTKDGKIINGSDNNAASISDVQTLVQQGVDNGYTNGNGITIQKDGTSNVISVNKGDGLTFDNGKLAVNTGDGLTVDETTKALKIKTSDSNLKVDQNGIGLNNVITIGTAGTAGTNAHPITIDGTKGEVSGLNNTSWDSTADYSESTKAATESQVAAAVKDAIKQAGDNDIHVAAGSYAVNDQNQVSMNLVDKNNDTKGTVIITDVAKSSEMGNVSKLADGVKNAGGKTTTVVDAINNVNTSMNTKIGDQNYSTSNTSGSNKYVQDGDSITSAIGKLDGAVQQATTAAGQHSTVSAGSNITVTPAKQTDGHTDYQVALNKDITVDSVTATTATTDTLTVNNSATIGGVTIANKTISGLDDTKIEKGSTNAVNAGTIWNELRPSGGTYINQNNTTAQNLTSLDTQVRATHDLINSDGKTIKIGGSDAATKIDVNGKDGKGRVITGVVSDANDPTSAANVGYVNGVTAANTQQIYRDMNNAYGRLNNNINKAAAGSNALAALHPLDYDPDDKADFAVGYGHYRNANAAAVGAFYHPNENTMVNVGVSLGNGDPGFNAGVSFKVGRGGAGREAMSKTEMAKVINSQSKEIDALKKDNADKDKRIDALEQKMAEILAKLDKNGK